MWSDFFINLLIFEGLIFWLPAGQCCCELLVAKCFQLTILYPWGNGKLEVKRKTAGTGLKRDCSQGFLTVLAWHKTDLTQVPTTRPMYGNISLMDFNMPVSARNYHWYQPGLLSTLTRRQMPMSLYWLLPGGLDFRDRMDKCWYSMNSKPLTKNV